MKIGHSGEWIFGKEPSGGGSSTLLFKQGDLELWRGCYDGLSYADIRFEKDGKKIVVICGEGAVEEIKKRPPAPYERRFLKSIAMREISHAVESMKPEDLFSALCEVSKASYKEGVVDGENKIRDGMKDLLNIS